MFLFYRKVSMNPPKNTKRTCGNKAVVMKGKGSRKGIGFLASGPVSLAYFLVASLGLRQRFTSFADKHGKIFAVVHIGDVEIVLGPIVGRA